MEGDVVSETDPKANKRLDPWLANQLRDALDARDADTIFALIGGYLEKQKLQMPAARLADWRARGLVEDGA